MPDENKLETTFSGQTQDEADHQVLTPYHSKETVERMMTGMMQEMRQGAERAERVRMQGAIDSLRSMGYNDEQIADELTSVYGLSSEEAESFVRL